MSLKIHRQNTEQDFPTSHRCHLCASLLNHKLNSYLTNSVATGLFFCFLETSSVRRNNLFWEKHDLDDRASTLTLTRSEWCDIMCCVVCFTCKNDGYVLNVDSS